MKKLLLFTLSLIFALTLSACGGTEQAEAEPTPAGDEPIFTEASAGDFRLKLHAGKSVYRSDEAIQIHATIEYIGDEDSILLWCTSPDTALMFSLTDGADFNMDPVSLDWYGTDIRLNKGTEYIADFHKSGGYVADDPMADFWREFYDQEELTCFS